MLVVRRKIEQMSFDIKVDIAVWISEPEPRPPILPSTPVYFTVVNALDGEPSSYGCIVGVDGTKTHADWGLL